MLLARNLAAGDCVAYVPAESFLHHCGDRAPVGNRKRFDLGVQIIVDVPKVTFVAPRFVRPLTIHGRELEPQAAQLLGVFLPVLGEFDVQVEEDRGAQQPFDVRAGGGADLA